MKIAVDYDDTYTRDPALWEGFMRSAHDAGHEVRIVTIRDDRRDRDRVLMRAENVWGVIYTRGVAKKFWCEHFGDGFVPDVWCDDRPETVHNNSTMTPNALALWRQANREKAA